MSIQQQIYELFELRKDTEQPHKIDQSIRAGVKVVGTNLWVLIFAILVASVGLNVNSTAVIIGAMLISPLMGPIVGIGYGTGINDFQLIKLAFKNLGIFTFLSILTSTLYFTLSPLNTETPELLARTSPNLWDVLIAFFGGSAGIIAITRKNLSNVVPGVAIATALMPPLCTAGFGIAQGNWSYFGGAFFLYCINSVFIACATLLFVKILGLPKHTDLDKNTTQRTHIVIGIVTMMFIVACSYLSYNFLKQRSFNTSIEELISESYKRKDYVIISHEINALTRTVTLTIGGDNPPKDLAKQLENSLHYKGLDAVNVTVRYSGSGKVDVSSLKNELRQDLYNNMQKQLDRLSSKNKQLKSQLGTLQSDKQKKKELIAEIRVQYQDIDDISISTGYLDRKKSKSSNSQTKTINDRQLILVTLTAKEEIASSDKQRLKKWLHVRFKDKILQIVFLKGSNQIILENPVK